MERVCVYIYELASMIEEWNVRETLKGEALQKKVMAIIRQYFRVRKIDKPYRLDACKAALWKCFIV